MDVKCSQCGEEYQLKPDENPSNFQCKCGGELIIKPDEATNIPEPSNHTPNNPETKLLNHLRVSSMTGKNST